MRSIILGAGEGNRLRPHTDARPKCMVQFLGKPILQWSLDAHEQLGLEEPTVVTGYRAEAIEALGLPTRNNPDYSRTNMVASLMSARDLLDGGDDVLILYGDIIYEPRLLEELLRCNAPASMVINTRWLELWRERMDDPLQDAETLRLDTSGNITELGKKPKSLADIQGQYTGMMRFSSELAAKLPSIYGALDPVGPYDGKDRDNMYMTSFLQHIIDSVSPIQALRLEGGWLEIDSVQDLECYQSLAASGRLASLCKLD